MTGLSAPPSESSAPRDSVCAEIDVAVDPNTAFEVFTRDIGVWWQRGKDLGTGRIPRRGTLRFEGCAGGSLVEAYPDGDPFVVGEVRVWEPGSLLVFEWRSSNFEPHQTTEVSVAFAASNAGTLVRLVHRGLEGLPVDHSARHGLGRGPEYTAMMVDWWEEMLADYAQSAEA